MTTTPSSKFILSNAGCTVNWMIKHLTFTVQIKLPVHKQRAKGADRSRTTHCRPRNYTETSRFLRPQFLARTKRLGDEVAKPTVTSVSQRVSLSLLLSRSSGRYSRTPTGNFAFHLTVTNAFIPATHYHLLKNYSVFHKVNT